MRFGASIWPWKWDAPYDAPIRRLGAAGFRATELIAWTPETITNYYTPETIDYLRKVLEDQDMVLSQFVISNSGITSEDPALRREKIDLFKRGVDTGVSLGAPIINTVTHFPFNLSFPHLASYPLMQMVQVDIPDGLDWDKNWNEYIEALRECADYAEQAGVRYSIEPHPFRYGSNADGLIRILDAVDSPAMGVNLDPSHLFPVGEIPHMVVRRLGSRVIHCHFSDNDSYTNAHWRPGMGKIDWVALMQALKDTGYDGTISLEFEDVPGVSRSPQSNQPTAYGRHDEATDGFEQEYKKALSYLTGIATDLGITVE
jgi:sugar phosphate isomerase/epimerase